MSTRFWLHCSYSVPKVTCCIVSYRRWDFLHKSVCPILSFMMYFVSSLKIYEMCCSSWNLFMIVDLMVISTPISCYCSIMKKFNSLVQLSWSQVLVCHYWSIKSDSGSIDHNFFLEWCCRTTSCTYSIATRKLWLIFWIKLFMTFCDFKMLNRPFSLWIVNLILVCI